VAVLAKFLSPLASGTSGIGDCRIDPSLDLTISDVIGLRSKKEMLWIYAWWKVTFV